jgi:hypothetical protein
MGDNGRLAKAARWMGQLVKKGWHAIWHDTPGPCEGCGRTTPDGLLCQECRGPR